MESCALREVWAAAREPAVLPTTPAAAVGTVSHRLLEEAGRGDFNTLPKSAIGHRWDELLTGAEATYSRSWLNRHLVPLARTLPDFEVRRLQALAAAKALAEASRNARNQVADQPGARPSGCEVPVSTPDGQAGGRIDAVSQTPEGPVLKDYKSGAIYTHGPGVLALKPEYTTQLKLYAGIYAAMTGVWPARLEVVPIAGPPEEVPFTETECQRLLVHALHLRDEINAIIRQVAPTLERMRRLAAPVPTSCVYCPYRPHCAPYEAARQDQPDGAWPLDTWGTLSDLRLLGNGRRLLTINTPTGYTYVRGIDPTPGRHPALDAAKPGDHIACYNLRPGGSATSLTEGQYTVFYREASTGVAGTGA
jgi:RecB family exonuclease